MIYLFSDTHLVPEGKRWLLEGFLEEARDRATQVVGIGDIYDLARHPLQAILEGPDGGRYHQMLLETAIKVETHLVLGNHDFTLGGYDAGHHPPLGPGFPSAIKVHPRGMSLDQVPGNPLLVHGWKEYDLGLAPLAPIYAFLFPLFPRFSYLYDRLFPTPSVVKKQSLPRFYREVLKMHYRAMADSMKRDRTIIWGHSHWQGVWPIYISEKQGWVMANAGDFVDGPGGLVLNPKTGFVHRWRP